MSTGAGPPPPPPPLPPPPPPARPTSWWRALPTWALPAAAAVTVAVVVGAVAVAKSGGSPSGSPASGVAGGEYVGKGQNIQRISFDVDGHVVGTLHGTYAVSCASSSGSSYQLQTFDDPDPIQIGADGTFTDTYAFTIGGGGHATLTVDGRITGAGATGHLQLAAPYCGTPRDGWAAALSGQALPPVPAYTPPDSTGCSPQPCSVLGGVTLTIASVHVVAEANDPNTRGIDVEFSVANASSAPISVSDANMTLTPQGSRTLYSSYAAFVDGSGQQVPCLHGNVPVLPPGGSETSQHACFLPSPDALAQPLTLTWHLLGSGSADLALGTAQ